MGDYFVTKDWKIRGQHSPNSLFLCEGEAEAEYVDKWLTSIGADDNKNRVLCFRGLSHIKAKISVLAKEPRFQSVDTICIFLDAEQDFVGRIQQAENMLRNLGFPHSGGNTVPWIDTANGKTSCVFISPDMASSGRIEDIVKVELGGKPGIFKCIEDFGVCSTATLGINFDEKKFVHSYIVAIREGMSLGAAFQRGLFDQSDPAYDDLNQLLQAAVT